MSRRATIAGILVLTLFGTLGQATITAATPAELPAITALSTTGGTTAGGSTLSIYGSGFTGATSVTFGKTKSSKISVISDTELRAKVPKRVAGSVDVRVRTAAGTSAVSPLDRFTYLARPTLTKVEPGIGLTQGGETVTLTGTGFFEPDTHVSFGGTAAMAVNVTSPTSLTVTTPPTTASLSNVKVTTPGGVSVASSKSAFTTSGLITNRVSYDPWPKPGPVNATGMGLTVGVAVDPTTGDTYYSDATNRLLERVSPSGVLSIAYGTAETPAPVGQLAVDDSGNVYIADDSKRRIYRLSPDGELTAIAGNGKKGTPKAGKATSSPLPGEPDYIPSGYPIALDAAGNVWIGVSDLWNCNGSELLKITPDGKLTLTPLTYRGSKCYGGATAGISALAIDRGTNKISAIVWWYSLVRVSSKGAITDLTDDVPLGDPSSMVVASDGSLIIADSGNDPAVYSWNSTDGWRTLLGDGEDSPTLTPVDGANIGLLNDRSIFDWEGGMLACAQIHTPNRCSGLDPVAVAASTNGDIFTSSGLKVTTNGQVSVVVGWPAWGRVAGSGGHASSNHIIRNPLNGRMVVATDYEIYELHEDGSTLRIAGNGRDPYVNEKAVEGPATATAIKPAGMTFSSDGALYIADSASLRVLKVTPNGQLTYFAGTGGTGRPVPGDKLQSPMRPIAIDSDAAGNLYVEDQKHVLKITPAGALSIIAGNGKTGTLKPGKATSAPLLLLGYGTEGPFDVAPDGTLAFFTHNSSLSSGRLVKVSPDGKLSIVSGSGTLTQGPATKSTIYPASLVFDSAGNLYVDAVPGYLSSRPTMHRIVKISPDGIVSNVTSATPRRGPYLPTVPALQSTVLDNSTEYGGSVGTGMFIDPSGVLHIGLTTTIAF